MNCLTIKTTSAIDFSNLKLLRQDELFQGYLPEFLYSCVMCMLSAHKNIP